MVSLAPFEPSCSVYGRECFLEFFRQRVGNDANVGDLAGQARPAGANGDGIADLEAIKARDRKPRHNEPMLADDFDHWLPSTHHRPRTEPRLCQQHHRSSIEAWHRHRARPTPSGRFL